MQGLRCGFSLPLGKETGRERRKEYKGEEREGNKNWRRCEERQGEEMRRKRK